MTLIKSVSGMRGTIGGEPGSNLTPVDIVQMASAYGAWIRASHARPRIAIGRDGRSTGGHVQVLVTECLTAMGIDVLDLGLSTTPSVEMYVASASAQGGIIITASHNPANWNALKFLDDRGEFISPESGREIIEIAQSGNFGYVEHSLFGEVAPVNDAIDKHIDAILGLDLVKPEEVGKKKYHVVIDCINSSGSVALPPLLDRLGCTYTLLNARPDGAFAHNPEPLERHLEALRRTTAAERAAVGIAVDPDVDRLALVDETGEYIGEEYTLVAVADYVLEHTPGNTVSNLSSTQALKDITNKSGHSYKASPVGEVHVVAEMKRTNAVIGGEGNGGIIYPPLHYGRDAMVGVALVLSAMAVRDESLSAWRNRLPHYYMAKAKVDLEGINADIVLDRIRAHYASHDLDTRDGIKVIMPGEWIHVRRSNTEPIIRVYTEAASSTRAQSLVQDVKALALVREDVS